MKKTLIILAIVLLGGTAMAQRQYDTLCGPDGRIPHWHYTHWYDTLDRYYRDTLVNHEHGSDIEGALNLYGYGYADEYVPRIRVKEEYVEHESLLKGVAVWQLDYRDLHFSGPITDSSRVAEYVYLFTWKRRSDSLLVIDSIRWDTAQAKVLKLPYNADTARYGFKYCYVYEAYFNKPVYVDSTFLLGGTRYNNEMEMDSYFHAPTVYAAMGCAVSYGRPMFDDIFYDLRTQTVYVYPPGGDRWGYFMPIIEYAEMDIRTADSTMGTAGPSGQRSKGTDQVIRATPHRLYRFSHWNDSVTDNPRTIHLMSDTVFTAYFEELPLHSVEGLCVDGHGYVSGAGTYGEGETATLVARTYTPNYHFSHWHDSMTDNPRSFVVTQDTVFTAYFEARDPDGVKTIDGGARFTLSPNPAHGHVRVELHGVSGEGLLTVSNATGQELVRRKVAPGEEIVGLDVSSLPAGAYFVTVVTPQGSHTEKLVIGD